MSAVHLPMIFASIPDGPRSKKNHAPAPTPQQPQPSSKTPTTPPTIHIVLLLFLSPVAAPFFLGLGTSSPPFSSAATAGSREGSSSLTDGTVSTVPQAGHFTFLPPISSLTASFLPH